MAADLSIKDYAGRVRRVLVVTLVLNCVVAFTKILYGNAINSIAVSSDGFHSFFDGVSNVVGLLGIWIASHPPDKEHPYGHRKFETMFTIVIAAMIFLTCLQILRKVYGSLFEDHRTLVTETSFMVMLMTTAVNVFVMSYEARKGRQLGSEYLVADAMHTKSDIFVSLSVIAGLILTKLGFAYADTMLGLVIAFLIARIGYAIVRDASHVLVDSVCLDNSSIRRVVNGIDGVRGCHKIRTRGSSNSVYIDLHVLVDRQMPVEEAHGIADTVEQCIKKEFPSVVDIVVHIEPEEPAR